MLNILSTLIALGILVFNFSLIAIADPLSQSEQQALNEYPNWVATGNASGTGCGVTGSGSGTVTLTGSDNEHEVWNFFKSAGLSDAQAAGIMGNLEQESPGFVPDRVQGGATSDDPSSLDPVEGYGIAQWNSDDIDNDFKEYHISGNDYDLGPQLALIIAMMKGMAPYNPSDISDTFKIIETMTDPVTVATYFDNNFEGGTDPGGTGPGPTNAGPGGIRENDATAIYKMLGGTGGTTTDPATGDCTQSGAVDCTTAAGNVKILCEAEQWKGIYYYYGGGHESLTDFEQSCPDLSNPPNNRPNGKAAIDGTSGNPSPCAVDCSGLVDLATDMAFSSENVDMGGASVTGIQQSPYWSPIKFSQLQPGDIVTLVTSADEHTEIVDSYDASSEAIVTFGAHYTGTQDGTVNSMPSAWTGAYRYTGPGSTSMSTN